MQDIDKDFVEFMEKSGKISGEEMGLSSIFGLIYIQPDDISIEEISKETGYSLASVSNKVKLLEAIGIVIRFRKPKSKKVYVKAKRNLPKITEEELIKRKMAVIDYSKEVLPSIINKYAKSKSKDDKLKINILKDYLTQIEKTKELLIKIKEGLKCLNSNEINKA
ncbi:MAG TPA: hypothetical protein PLX15_04750 [Candidatus Woesearchaeota archaeon]|nr:hypothetical protein [Candidatus Woesearchaeota archaeon]